MGRGEEGEGGGRIEGISLFMKEWLWTGGRELPAVQQTSHRNVIAIQIVFFLFCIFFVPSKSLSSLCSEHNSMKLYSKSCHTTFMGHSIIHERKALLSHKFILWNLTLPLKCILFYLLYFLKIIL